MRRERNWRFEPQPLTRRRGVRPGVKPDRSNDFPRRRRKKRKRKKAKKKKEPHFPSPKAARWGRSRLISAKKRKKINNNM